MQTNAINLQGRWMPVIANWHRTQNEMKIIDVLRAKLIPLVPIEYSLIDEAT